MIRLLTRELLQSQLRANLLGVIFQSDSDSGWRGGRAGHWNHILEEGERTLQGPDISLGLQWDYKDWEV